MTQNENNNIAPEDVPERITSVEVSEAPVPDAGEMKTTSGTLPSFAVLLSLSLEIFRLRALLALKVLGLGIGVLVGVGVIIAIPLFAQKSMGVSIETLSLPTIALAVIAGLVAIAALIVTSVASFAVFARHEEDMDVKTALLYGRKYAIPVVVTGAITSLVVSGGYLLVLIPGIYLAIATAFTAVVILRTEKRWFDAVDGSLSLVKGDWFRVFWRIFLMGIIGVVPGVVMMIVTVFAALATKSVAVGVFGAVVSVILMLLGGLVMTAFNVVLFKALQGIKPLQDKRVLATWIYIVLVVLGVIFNVITRTDDHREDITGRPEGFMKSDTRVEFPQE